MFEFPPVSIFLLAVEEVDALNAGTRFAPTKLAEYKAEFTAIAARAKSLLLIKACSITRLSCTSLYNVHQFSLMLYCWVISSYCLKSNLLA